MLAVVPPQLANLRQEVSCVREGLKCLKVWNVCSYLECCLHSWHWAPSGEIGPLSFLPFLLSFPKATRGQKETSLPFPFFFSFWLYVERWTFFFWSTRASVFDINYASHVCDFFFSDLGCVWIVPSATKAIVRIVRGETAYTQHLMLVNDVVTRPPGLRQYPDLSFVILRVSSLMGLVQALSTSYLHYCKSLSASLLLASSSQFNCPTQRPSDPALLVPRQTAPHSLPAEA